MEPQKRIKTFDQIKGLVAILVIFSHAANYIGIYIKDANPAYRQIHDTLHLFYMPLLFCISGYFYTDKDSKINTIIKNLLALYIPFLITNYFMLFERIIGATFFGVIGETPINITFIGLLKRLVIADGIGWFIEALLFARIFTRLFHQFFNDYVFFIITIMITILMIAFTPDISYLVRFLPSYWFGYLYKNGKVPQNKPILIAESTIIIVFLYSTFLFYPNDCMRNISGIILFLLLTSFPQILPKGKLIDICGQDCFVFYIIHCVTNHSLLVLLSIYVHNNILILVTFCIIQLFLFLGVRFLYQHIKIFKWLEYIFYPYRLYKKVKER